MGRTQALGYGYQHQLMRRRWAPIVNAGGVICTRYGDPQFPACPGLIRPGTPWELGHDDRTKAAYTGPEHRACNRRAGGLKRTGQLEALRATPLRW